jgi:hypothetical protein
MADEPKPPKTTEGAPTSQPHSFDDASLNALEFLFAVMRDKSTDLRDRTRAAELLLHIIGPSDACVVRQDREVTTIRVSGKGLH